MIDVDEAKPLNSNLGLHLMLSCASQVLMGHVKDSAEVKGPAGGGQARLRPAGARPTGGANQVRSAKAEGEIAMSAGRLQRG